jgi:hypothetical protein
MSLKDTYKELVKNLEKVESNKKIINGEIERGTNLYNKLKVVKADIEAYENTKETLHEQINNYENESSLLKISIQEIKDKLEKEANEFSLQVVDRLPNIKNRLYLIKCIIFLKMDTDYVSYLDEHTDKFIDINITLDGLSTLSENEIIKAAHRRHNGNLINNNGPYTFYHNHKDSGIYLRRYEKNREDYPMIDELSSDEEKDYEPDGRCKWDGNYKRCWCSCKCPSWDTSKVDWLKDVSLDSTYPKGKVICTW